ncbi:MAG: rRNA maturation RNase YbeY [bacterium]|nr:rRNA maturation RNase YbeY [bacterium]
MPLTLVEANTLWQAVVGEMGCTDDLVTVVVVKKEEARKLNKQYRGLDRATNVLTFSYDEGEHDVALCDQIAKEEAKEHGMSWRDYMAWLLVHAFLHAAGMDHERSLTEAELTRERERNILQQCGYKAVLSE